MYSMALEKILHHGELVTGICAHVTQADSVGAVSNVSKRAGA
jgi:hypothetical protein